MVLFIMEFFSFFFFFYEKKLSFMHNASLVSDHCPLYSSSCLPESSLILSNSV